MCVCVCVYSVEMETGAEEEFLQAHPHEAEGGAGESSGAVADVQSRLRPHLALHAGRQVGPPAPCWWFVVSLLGKDYSIEAFPSALEIINDQ